MPRFHGGDDPIHGPPLEGVHGRGPGPVEMPQLRVAPLQGEPAAVLQPEGHRAAVHARDLGDPAVGETETGIVAGPADAVPGAPLDSLLAVDLHAPARAASRAGSQPTVLPSALSRRTTPFRSSVAVTFRSSPRATPRRR